MKRSLKWLGAFGLAVVALAGFGFVAYLVGRHRIAWFDKSIISIVQGWETPWLTSVMKGFSWIGTTVPVTVLSVLIVAFLWFVLRRRGEVVLFIAVMLGSSLLNSVLKATFRRERPNLHRLAEAPGFAFPSGHAMAAFALYGVLAYLIWRHIKSAAGRTVLVGLCAFMCLCIGLSRIYLGVHYPSDVLGGFLASGFWLGLCIGIYNYYRRTGHEA